MQKEIKQFLRPPGQGLYTVTTGSDLKNNLYDRVYQTTEKDKIQSIWSNNLQNRKNSDLLLLGIPSDCGGGIHRGANWGPLALREALVNGNFSSYNKVLDIGDIPVIPHLLWDEYLDQDILKSCRDFLYENPSSKYPVSPLSLSYELLNNLYKEKSYKIISLGGDHSVSYPLVRSYLENNKKRTGVLHFDAHTDLLEKRMGVPLCFGSWTYHILHLLEEKDDLIQVGIRASAKNKEFWEERYGIKQIWSKEILETKLENTISTIINHFKKKNIEEIYVTFDVDALDESIISATGTPEKNGLEVFQCVEILKSIANNFKITGADLVEVAPFVKHRRFENKICQTMEISSQILALLIELME